MLNNIFSENMKKFRLEKKFTQEDEAYQAAVVKFPECWKMYNEGAWACACLKRYEEALDLFRKCGELDPAFYEDLNGMAFCYDKMREYEKAISTEEKLLDEL